MCCILTLCVGKYDLLFVFNVSKPMFHIFLDLHVSLMFAFEKVLFYLGFPSFHSHAELSFANGLFQLTCGVQTILFVWCQSEHESDAPCCISVVLLAPAWHESKVSEYNLLLFEDQTSYASYLAKHALLFWNWTDTSDISDKPLYSSTQKGQCPDELTRVQLPNDWSITCVKWQTLLEGHISTTADLLK